ncbi:solute carrier family 35 member C2 isoform X2 [Zootoca vivipara]|uniref:solute carrier family 35 member C2 isoform X2 n=1 Tax=Zootoca vivipara TaxID=8524 RepID=UPI00293BCCD7|nr:solute carrier family 35 member C2 isoform X2 [Zootoca vivipara]
MKEPEGRFASGPLSGRGLLPGAPQGAVTGRRRQEELVFAAGGGRGRSGLGVYGGPTGKGGACRRKRQSGGRGGAWRGGMRLPGGSGGGAGSAALVVALVLLYYAFSIGITFYNKWIMKSFGFPLFMTLLHLLVIFTLSGLTRRCARRPARPLLPWAAYLRQVGPAALSTALDVGLSNWSFLYITVSLYTMTKSSAVLFILFFSLVFKLEEPATQFDMEGFAMVLGASFLGGIRWTLTQILLQKDELGLQNPIDTMFHLQPAMFLGLFPLFAAFEGLPLSASEKLFRFHEVDLLLGLLGKLALGGLLAFGLGFSEFLLVSKTSSLALSVSGIFKEVCTLLLATHLMGDHLSLLNWLGFVVCLLGLSLHVALKALNATGQKGARRPKESCSSPDLELLLLHHQEEEDPAGFPQR